MYVTYEYYSITYGGSAISSTEFNKYERLARVYIDNVTFNRLQADATLITTNVKDCICELMELKQKIENDGGIKASESVGNTSTTYVVDTNTTESNKLLKVVKMYLGHTDLLYRGV